jgi:hypothetical protein
MILGIPVGYAVAQHSSLEPEVAGELGGDTVLDRSAYPPTVGKLHYVLTGWLGDELLESFPCYIVTERVADAIQEAAFTGYIIDNLRLEVSDQFRELYPSRQVPPFRWLRITGEPNVDDFGMSEEHLLVVSDRALAILRQFTLNECDIKRV